MTDIHSIAPHILVVDDDTRLRSLLKKFLSEQGYLVTPAASAEEARKVLQVLAAELIVLDVMMPGETGVEFAQTLRAKGETMPILMLTALGDVENRIAGLEAGADDYLPKPFEPKELLLRIDSILRRSIQARQHSERVHFGPWSFDVAAQQLYKGSELFLLTSSEAGLLAQLAGHIGQPVSRAALAEGSNGLISSERSVDVQINRLRKKLEEEPSKPIYIQTVRSAGYVLKP